MGVKKERRSFAGCILAGSSYHIGTAANRLMLHGPVGKHYKERNRMDALELSVLFLWNLWWLCLAVKHRGKRKMATACLVSGWLFFLWGHSILLPLIGAGIWMATVMGYGICINNCFLSGSGKKTRYLLPVWEKITLGLTTGSAAWMVMVCGISLTGHGGIGLWRKIAVVLCVGDSGSLAVEKQRNFQ